MQLVNEIFDLYKRNLPEIVRNEVTVKRILDDSDNHIIIRRVGDTLAGVSIINANAIYLLCVDKQFQKRGMGSDLLIQSEKYIAAKGYDKIVIGAGKEYIMPGVPMANNAHLFFIKHGYVHSWGDTGCFDMQLQLEDFDYDEHSIGDTINGITYRWASLEDIECIITCVSDAEPKFVRYYADRGIYHKDSGKPVLVAVKNNEVLGVVMLEIERDENIGSVGVTATMHKARNKGIATNLVRLGTKHLKEIGLSRACLGYTYTDIVGMYGRAGYKISMEYFMGEKHCEQLRCFHKWKEKPLA